MKKKKKKIKYNDLIINKKSTDDDIYQLVKMVKADVDNSVNKIQHNFQRFCILVSKVPFGDFINKRGNYSIDSIFNVSYLLKNALDALDEAMKEYKTLKEHKRLISNIYAFLCNETCLEIKSDDLESVLLLLDKIIDEINTII